MTIVSLDKAGNTSTFEYEFYLDYGFPKFESRANVIIDDDTSSFYDDTAADIKYYDLLNFYVAETYISAGQSGIKKVEYCLIKLASATNTAPSVIGCDWREATLSDARYYGTTENIKLSGYYRIAYRVTNNLGITTSDSKVLFNG